MIVLIQPLVLVSLLCLMGKAFATSADLSAVCASIPAECRQETEAYRQLVAGDTFAGVAEYSNALKAGIGSCGFDPSSLNGIAVVALPRPFMFMSFQPNLCNTYCNPLCGSVLRITNTATGLSADFFITDTAATDNNALVLSEDGYLAIGGTITDGNANVTFFLLGS